jgi:hypothetical protein
VTDILGGAAKQSPVDWAFNLNEKYRCYFIFALATSRWKMVSQHFLLWLRHLERGGDNSEQLLLLPIDVLIPSLEEDLHYLKSIAADEEKSSSALCPI